jgi:hypothetical protein
MKKFLGSLALFLCCCSILYLLLIYVTSNLKYEKEYSILDKLTGNAVETGISTFWQFHEVKYSNAPIDILVLGSSIAYRAFNTYEFDKAGLNVRILATGAQPPKITYYLLKEYLNKTKPKLIIYDVCLSCNKSKGVESFYDLCRNIPISWMHFFMALTVNETFAYHNLCAAWINQLLKPLYQQIKYSRPKAYYKGFNTEFKYDSTLRFNFSSRPDRPEKMNEQQVENIEYIEAIAQYARRNNVHLLFTRQPSLWNYDVYHMAKVIAIARKYKVPIADMYRYKYWLNPAKNFYDKSHLNASGAKRITKIFIKRVLKQDPEFKFLWTHAL